MKVRLLPPQKGAGYVAVTRDCGAVYNIFVEGRHMKAITFSDFWRNASRILDLVEKGERICILRHRKVIAKIVPPGSHESKPAWKRPGLRLVAAGASLSRAVLEERRSIL
jgi:antitoxin (DNA-binding transcriptional repressor) of toxin-antitoxin stability system